MSPAVFYYLFDTKRAMNAWYGDESSGRSSGSCFGRGFNTADNSTFSGSGGYLSGGHLAGKISCEKDAQSAYIAWTDNQLLIGARAFVLSPQYSPRLFNAWKQGLLDAT